MTDQIETPSISRRRLLIASAQLTLGLSILSPIELLAKKSPADSIVFYHTHTGEQFELGYPSKKPSLKVKRNLYSFLRDFRTGEVHPIDFRLIDILYKIKRETGSKGVFEVISGYRSPKTNENLRSHSSGVAKKSLHLRGQAIDIRLTNVSTKDVRDAAISLKAGGVGYYAKSDFVHIDTGKVRFW
jgi:uncharacterized protein YcbK (DUF882 family)